MLTFEGYTGGFHAPRNNYGEMYVTVTCSARRRTDNNRLHESLSRPAQVCQSRIFNFLLRTDDLQECRVLGELSEDPQK